MANLAWAFCVFCLKHLKEQSTERHFVTFVIKRKGPGPSVGIATGCGLDDPGSNPL